MLNKQQMEKQTESTICWVYVLQTCSKSRLSIGYTTDIMKQLEKTNYKIQRLIYARSFDEISLAIGHKLFLENISAISLRRFIKTNNPELKDIQKKLLSKD